MGSHTIACNCPNVARVGNHKAFHDPLEDASFNGWTWDEDCTYENALFPYAFKGHHGESVLFLNSHPYAAIGRDDWVVYGPNTTHVQAFLTTLGITGVEILAEAIVQQTL